MSFRVVVWIQEPEANRPLSSDPAREPIAEIGDTIREPIDHFTHGTERLHSEQFASLRERIKRISGTLLTALRLLDRPVPVGVVIDPQVNRMPTLHSKHRRQQSPIGATKFIQAQPWWRLESLEWQVRRIREAKGPHLLQASSRAERPRHLH